jgi:hypothetical protein
MKSNIKKAIATLSEPREKVVVVIVREDRTQDKIVVTTGKTVTREIPAVVFDKQQTQKLYQLIDED